MKVDELSCILEKADKWDDLSESAQNQSLAMMVQVIEWFDNDVAIAERGIGDAMVKSCQEISEALAETKEAISEEDTGCT